ncbi:hypothetical protein H1R20_g11521, partial [Candolleomyces eurysporus]
MGRNKKHYTPEAMAEAQNATEINCKQQERYQKDRIASTQKSTDTRPTGPKPPVKGLRFYWVERAGTIPDRLNTYLGGKSDCEYINQICENFIKDHSDIEQAKDKINNHILGIGEIQKSLSRYQGKILNQFGKLEEYNATEPVALRMTNLVRWLEDILIWAMVDTEELIARYQDGRLNFQR